MDSDIAGKKRKVFSYSSENFAPEYIEDVDQCEGLARHHDARKESKNDKSTETSVRTKYIDMVQKSLYEFHRLQMLVNHLKSKEVLGLQTCERTAITRTQKQSLDEKCAMRKESLVKCQDIMSKGLAGARALVLARRAQCQNSLKLRKTWRIVSEATPQKQFLTFDQHIAVDCSIETTLGDTQGQPNGLLRITSEDIAIDETASVQYSLQASLAHSQGGIVCRQSLWHLLYGASSQDTTGVSLLDQRCRMVSHDRRARLIFQHLCSLLATEAPGTVGCTSSLGTYRRITPNIDSKNMQSSFLEEPLCDQLFFTCVSRCEVRAALSESWTLGVALVPIAACETPSDGEGMDSELLRACQHMVGLACLSLDNLITSRSSRILPKGSLVGGAWKQQVQTQRDGWRSIREDTSGLVAGSAPLATLKLVRMMQHRVVLTRAVYTIKSLSTGPLSVSVSVATPEPRGAESFVFVSSMGGTCAFRVDHSSIQVLASTRSLPPATPVAAISQYVNKGSLSLLKSLPPKISTFSFSSQSLGGDQVEMQLNSISQLVEYLQHKI
jgi:hypothetical protein